MARRHGHFAFRGRAGTFETEKWCQHTQSYYSCAIRGAESFEILAALCLTGQTWPCAETVPRLRHVFPKDPIVPSANISGGLFKTGEKEAATL